MANSKRTLFLKRRLRVRNKLRKINTGKPRLSVHRSAKNISVQVIDDIQGITLASASTLEKDLGFVGKNNVDASAKVGSVIAERAKPIFKTYKQKELLEDAKLIYRVQRAP